MELRKFSRRGGELENKTEPRLPDAVESDNSMYVLFVYTLENLV
jgi:hypothetical protein